MQREVKQIVAENNRRLQTIAAPFNPVTGVGSIGPRFILRLPDFPIPVQHVPESMKSLPLVRQLQQAGSLSQFITEVLAIDDTPGARAKVVEAFVRARCRHDFPFWAASFVYIKNKGGGDDVSFRLSRPQRRFASALEESRLAGQPIRIVLLKARQWGGSTLSQIYIAWLQLLHMTGLNSLIIAHVKDGSIEIRDMFDRMMNHYPLQLLYNAGETVPPKAPKIVGVGGSMNIHRIPQRNCKIKIGTAEKPDSCRGGDYNLVHLSEVGVWRKTEGKSPEDIVQSACSGILYKPYTMIVYESTANGTGNFFQREYDAAKRGESQFKPLFISWFEIEKYSLDFPSTVERDKFAQQLWLNRFNENVRSEREECGCYLWHLWTLGATLEAINWYIQERKGKSDHGIMASEYPSDDVEAFVHSGECVFDKYKVYDLKPSCRPPSYIGDVYSDYDSGKDALKDIRFREDRQGLFWVWSLPDITPEEIVKDRYLTVVDVGGRSRKADWSVIVVFDRIFMIDGGKPVVVAQWYGHTDIDLLAWKAAQIAAFYDNSLLVIESNTLETHDRERQVDGDQSHFILNQIRDVYPNLYARRQSEQQIAEGQPKRYGFHTNASTKPMIISTLVKAVREAMYVERDERCLDEYITYEKKPNGSYGAQSEKHDDILMTRAIGLHICFFEMELPKIIPASGSAHRPRGKLRTAASF